MIAFQMGKKLKALKVVKKNSISVESNLLVFSSELNWNNIKIVFNFYNCPKKVYETGLTSKKLWTPVDFPCFLVAP